MKGFTIGLGLVLPLFASCTVFDVGTGSGTGIALGGFHYSDEEIGAYAAMHSDPGVGAGTNYDGILGAGGFPGDSRTGEVPNLIGWSGGMTYRAHEMFGVFAGVASTTLTTYYNYYDPLHILGPGGNYNVTGEQETKFGLEIGSHVFLTDHYALGIRMDLAADIIMYSLAFSF
jgi:hypothetical protein